MKEKQYKDNMKQLGKEVPRIYLDSNWFVKLLKPIFAWVFFSQLMQSMVFNGVLDFPLLILFLIMLSLYAFRKSYYFFYQIFTMYIVLLIHFIITLKLLFLILTNISFIQSWFVDNKEDNFVKICQTLFGINFGAVHKGEGKSRLTQLTFHFLLLSCKLTASIFKQCKWADIRSYPTKENNENDWFFARLNSFLILKTSIKEEKEVKREDDKNKNRKLIKSKNFKVKKRNEVYLQFKKDLNSYLPMMIIWITRFLLIFQVYMYHGGLSLYHMIWVLCSFILNIKFALFMSIVIYLPLYSVECMLIYGS